MIIGNRAVIQERRYRLLRRHGGKACDLLRCRAEAGAIDQMAGVIEAPIGSRDRREVVDPGSGRWPAAHNFVVNAGDRGRRTGGRGIRNGRFGAAFHG